MKSMSVIAENLFAVSKENVWSAITDKNEMKHWYFDLEEFIPEVGFEFRFWGGTEENKYFHICKITEVIPYKVLEHSWRYDGISGNTTVRFELTEFKGKPGKTKLTLSHSGIETFPADNPDLARSNFEAGWKYFIGTSLKNYLEP